MKQEEVKKVLTSVQTGTKLRLTYKDDCPLDPFYLLGMETAGIIQFENPMDGAVIWAAQQSGKWDHPNNRIIEVKITDKFDSSWFIGRTSWALESLEIVTL